MSQPAASQPAASQQIAPTLQSTIALIDTSLNEVRYLRDVVVRAHKKINDAINGETEISDAYWKGLVDRLAQANKIYESLETHAKSLPSTSTPYPQMERLARFLTEAHFDPVIKETYEKTLEVSTWTDTSNTFLQYYVAFFRRFVTSQRRSLIVERPLTKSNYAPGNSPQHIFAQSLTQASQDGSYKKLGCVFRYLEKSTLNAVIELKFGRVAEKIYACHQKMLLVVNNGVIESLLLIAPHEDWTYLDEGRKTVDILKESRYTVYQKLTVQANIHLMQTIHNISQPLTARNLISVLNLLSRFHEALNLKCKVCNRTMKNCLPPTIFDIIRSNTQALHEACR